MMDSCRKREGDTLEEQTKDWQLYKDGIDYKSSLNLFATTNRNERFYAGHHWDGVDTGGLPQVRLNVTKRIVNWKVSQIMSDMLTMQFSAENSANYDPTNPDKIAMLQEVARLLTDYSKTTWERLKQDAMNEQVILDAALSGDGIVYFPWDETINAGKNEYGAAVVGDINEEIIDNVNYFPGNTSDPRPNDKNGPLQPYIILSFRKLVKDAREEAKRNKVPQEEINKITGDSDTQYRAGDMAKKEPNKDTEGGFCTVLLKMWTKTKEIPKTDPAGFPVLDQKTGKQLVDMVTTIWARKSTQAAIIRKDWDTGLHRYPVASMQWTPRKNSCHGEAEATELIPNNIAINKLMATMILWTMLNAYPKPVYDSTRIPAWSNDITKAIPVDGDVTNAAQYLQPAGLPASVQKLFELLVQTTKDMAGANETALGDDSVTKTAAGIVALQKASALPLSMNKRRFAQFVEDIGLIWLDFWLTKYSVPRMLTIKRTNPETKKEEVVQIPFDGSQYNETTFSLAIDVGASTQYSDITAIQTMDSWLERQLISFKSYLERIQQFHLVPDVEGLIDEAEMQEQGARQQEMLAAFEQFVSQLSPELQAAIQRESEMLVGGGAGGVLGM
jgi:hypothetical protein